MIVKLALPVFEIVTDCVVLLPTVTAPNDTEPGETEITGEAAGPPLPEKLTTVGDVGALLTRDMVPLTLPEAVGANFTLKFELLPAAIVRGNVSPFSPNVVDPPIFAAVTVKLASPALDILID